MSKRLVIFLLTVVLSASVLSDFSLSVFAVNAKDVESNEIKVADVTEDNITDKVTLSRFENMLNHNNLYNDDFNDDKVIIENSIISLLDYAAEGEIKKTLVTDFILNMYGRVVDENSAVYDRFPASEGNFAVIPRGFDKFSHNITFADEIDGGYVVYSVMTVDAHDGETYAVNVKSVFVPNEGSCYGYNILSSEFLGENTSL